MASSYTPLGVELMVTGENAGTWGTKTNTNLQIFEQISGGYKVVTLNTAGTGANTTALGDETYDGTTGASLATRVIILGAVSPQTITGNKIVTIPNDVENFYFMKNSTGGTGHTVQLKTVSGAGTTITWATTDKGWKILYADGAGNIVEITTPVSAGGSTTQIQYNDSGSLAGDADLIWTAGAGMTINSQKEMRLADADDSLYVALRSHATISPANYTLTFPAATGSTDQYLKTDGSGNLSWVSPSAGGISMGKAIAAAIVFG
jgi:hypothetical protein